MITQINFIDNDGFIIDTVVVESTDIDLMEQMKTDKNASGYVDNSIHPFPWGTPSYWDANDLQWKIDYDKLESQDKERPRLGSPIS